MMKMRAPVKLEIARLRGMPPLLALSLPGGASVLLTAAYVRELRAELAIALKALAKKGSA
jgi:hypothetical protein